MKCKEKWVVETATNIRIMAEFIEAYKRILQNEGGYVNDPKDAGGETYSGISRRYNQNWAGWAIVDKNKPLKKGEKIPGEQMESLVKIFYKQTQWDKIKGDSINSQWIAEFTVDWYVTSGKDAIQALQAAVGVTADGVIGNQTIAAVNAADETIVKAKLLKARRDFYQAIVKRDPTKFKFLKGWLNRVNSFA